MELNLRLAIERQPDDETCGPTCLHAVYGFYNNPLLLEDVITDVTALSEGGTLAVFLACDALRRGYRATIYTYNVQIFDPTWFDSDGHGATDMAAKLRKQSAAKLDDKLRMATSGYLDFIEHGGELRFEELTAELIERQLDAGRPIITGLSATYLYRECRELGRDGIEDDVRGYPQGHFVVICGYDPPSDRLMLADPLQSDSVASARIYPVDIDRTINAIMLGVLTYDANLLVLEPPAADASITS